MAQTYSFRIIMPNRSVVTDSCQAVSSYLAKQIMESRYPGANCMVVSVK